MLVIDPTHLVIIGQVSEEHKDKYNHNEISFFGNQDHLIDHWIDAGVFGEFMASRIIIGVRLLCH